MNLKKILLESEYKVIFYGSYLISLIVLFFIKGWTGILFTHLFFVFIVSLLSFGKQFIINFFFPFITVYLLIDSIRFKKYIRKFPLNNPVETVVVLGHSNWLKYEAWIKPNFCLSEIKSLVRYLVKMRKNFSFYPTATIQDVHKIMENREVKEVYFFGHGDSHVFQLGTDEILYYCDFNKEKHGKEFVHQFHCGTLDGKSLVDYVVPENNREKCFYVRKSINSFDVVRELKRRMNSTNS